MSMLRRKSAIFFLFAAFALLAGATSSDSLAQSMDYTSQLADRQTFLRFSGRMPGIPSRAVKFTVDLLDQNRIYFQDTGKYDFHYPFLKNNIPRYKTASFQQYADAIYGSDLAAGILLYSETYTLSESATPGTLAFELYMGEPGQPINAETITANFEKVRVTFEALMAHATFAQGKIGISLPMPLRFNPVVRKLLTEARITAIWQGARYEKEFLGAQDTAIYNVAESYGYLKSITTEQLQQDRYSDRDILIFDFIPLDIGPLAGVISTYPQVPYSHIMMRAINMNIPDIYISKARENATITKYLGQLVRFTTRSDGTYSIEGADTLGQVKLSEAAEAYFQARHPKVEIPAADLTTLTLKVWTEAGSNSRSEAKTYGAKGANFAFLDEALSESGINRKLYQGGFLVPFAYYDRHLNNPLTAKVCASANKKCIEATGLTCETIFASCTAAVGLPLSTLVSHVQSQRVQMAKDSDLRRQNLAFLRQAIAKTKVDKGFLSEVKKLISKSYAPTRRIRFRSSTNAEDLAGLSGAGLYESKSGCMADDMREDSQGPSACSTTVELERTRELINYLEAQSIPDTSLIEDLRKKLNSDRDEVGEAIAKVYASLWTDRAYKSREFYGIDHSEVKMAILAHPAFQDENANGVVVVEPQGQDGFRVYVSVQIRDISVTNPEFRGAEPEVTELAFNPADDSLVIKRIQSSSLADGALLNPTQLKSLAEQVATVYKAFKSDPRNNEKLDKLDVEIIVDSDGKVQIKQARPLPDGKESQN